MQRKKAHFSFIFTSLIMMCVDMNFGGLSYLGFTQLLEFLGLCILPNTRYFQSWFLQILSFPLSFSTEPQWYMTQMLDLLLLFHKIMRFWFHFCFQSIFCLLLRLGELYCSVLKFTGILCSVISTLLLSPSTGLYLKIPVMAFFRYSFITSTFFVKGFLFFNLFQENLSLLVEAF